MIASGVIVEYNPFHNGHLYHLTKTKEKTAADCLIAVMSGHFLQRGEPALVSKFSRAKMALAAGCDIVVELPYAFSTQHAEIFARGAVEILSALDCTYLVFGSENGDIAKFQDTLALLNKYKKEIDATIHTFLKEGMSYPKAYEQAFQHVSTKHAPLDITKPNNMLGLNYLKAIRKLHSSLEPLTIKRIGSGYHDVSVADHEFASATAIRKKLIEQKTDLAALRNYIPDVTYRELTSFHAEFGTFAHWESLWPFLKYQLLGKSAEELQDIYEIEEGLEYRMKTIAKGATSFQSFLEQLKTKRYTWTRLQRAAVHVLTNTKKEEMKRKSEKAEYIRLLGISDTGRKYLKYKKKEIALPVISRISKSNLDMLKLDIKASYIYSFAYGLEKGQKLMDQEVQQPPILI